MIDYKAKTNAGGKMKKKYPKTWIMTVSEFLYQVKSEIEKGHLIDIQKTTDALLSSAQSAGMLKDAPEPLEIEWCVEHESARDGNEACQVRNFGALIKKYPTCRFIKMREVEE